MTDLVQAQAGGGLGGGPRLPEGAQASAVNLREHAAALASSAEQLQDEADEALLAQLEQSVATLNGSVLALSSLLQGFGGDIERQAVKVQQIAADVATQLALLKEDHSPDNVSTWKTGAVSLSQEAAALESLITASVQAAPTQSESGGGEGLGAITAEELQSVQLTHVEPPPEAGVPEWAEEEYRIDSARVMIASMDSDGLIGSMYFDDGSRIRTTHKSGPERGTHQGATTLQFNINDSIANALFIQASGMQETDRGFHKAKYRWLANAINNTPVSNLPSWVIPIDGPDTAEDISSEDPSGELRLFEIFRKVSNGQVQGWHPSRGTAVRFETNKQVISVLEAALAEIDGQGEGEEITDLAKRNEVFYNFVIRRLPDWEDYMRHPNDV